MTLGHMSYCCRHGHPNKPALEDCKAHWTPDSGLRTSTIKIERVPIPPHRPNCPAEQPSTQVPRSKAVIMPQNFSPCHGRGRPLLDGGRQHACAREECCLLWGFGALRRDGGFGALDRRGRSEIPKVTWKLTKYPAASWSPAGLLVASSCGAS